MTCTPEEGAARLCVTFSAVSELAKGKHSSLAEKRGVLNPPTSPLAGKQTMLNRRRAAG